MAGQSSSLVSHQVSASIFHKSVSLCSIFLLRGRTHLCPLGLFLSLGSTNPPHGQGEAFRVYSDVDTMIWLPVIWERQSLRFSEKPTGRSIERHAQSPPLYQRSAIRVHILELLWSVSSWSAPCRYIKTRKILSRPVVVLAFYLFSGMCSSISGNIRVRPQRCHSAAVV